MKQSIMYAYPVFILLFRNIIAFIHWKIVIINEIERTSSYDCK